MAIKFRCSHCRQLMSISSRKAGSMVECPSCGEDTLVPREEYLDLSRSQKKKESKQETTSPEETSESKPESKSSAEIPSNPWNQEIDVEEGEFEIRKAETEFEDMDLTPMVDVTFLLLIFFMITASFTLQKTIQIPKPDPEQQGAAQSREILEELLDESIQVDINEENQISVDDEPLADPNELVTALNDKMVEDGKSELVITAHAASLHENVIKVIDAAKEVGMQKIRLASSGSPDE